MTTTARYTKDGGGLGDNEDVLLVLCCVLKPVYDGFGEGFVNVRQLLELQDQHACLGLLGGKE